MFTGSITAIERNREFAGPGEKAYQERKEKTAQADGGQEHPGPVDARTAVVQLDVRAGRHHDHQVGAGPPGALRPRRGHGPSQST